MKTKKIILMIIRVVLVVAIASVVSRAIKPDSVNNNEQSGQIVDSKVTENSFDKVDDSEGSMVTKKPPSRDYLCDNVSGREGVPRDTCETFLDLWYEYHAERLGVSRDVIDLMTAIDSFSVNTTATQGITLYRINYVVTYGDDISIRTHDAFPLSIPPHVDPPYPGIDVPRDNSLLTTKDLKNIDDAWYSNLTDFPLGPLAYDTLESVTDDIQQKYVHATVDRGSVDGVTFHLIFNRENTPTASLKGIQNNEENCYSGVHNLLTKEGEIHWSSPCVIY